MALKINTQTNLNDMFDKFASLPGDKENATGPDPKHHDKLAKKAKEKKQKKKQRNSEVPTHFAFFIPRNRLFFGLWVAFRQFLKVTRCNIIKINVCPQSNL